MSSNQKTLLVIGWNERTRHLIKDINQLIRNLNIIVIDKSPIEIPYNYKNITCVCGNAMFDETLIKANIDQIDTAIITADRHSPETMSDNFVIISLLAMKSLNPSIYTIVEIISKTQVNNAKRAGANRIIHTSKDFSHSVVKKLHAYL